MSRDRHLKDRIPKEKKIQTKFQDTQKQTDPETHSSNLFGVFLSSVGNQQVARFLDGGMVQAKLNLSTPGDAYERQADSIAQQMVHMKPNAEPLKAKINTVQAKGGSSGSVPGATEKGIKQLSGKGSSLSKPVREFFEPRLGVDLGNVKVHTGSNANTLARSVNARAFTYQNQIVFGKGQYQPGTTEGNKLIGHELVHTVQQGKAIYRKPDLPNLRASDEFYELLQNIEKTTKFPIYSMILNSPTLRPYAVEQAAKADILENTSTHPGTTFKGTVGEAYVLYRLLYAGNEKNAWLTDMFNFAFPQPMTMIEEGINKHLGDYSLESFSELLGLLDGYMPDLLLLRLGGEFEVKTGAVDTRLEVVPTINNAITKDNTRVHQHRLGSETCVCLYEITTSWAINHLIKRAIDVATWANLVSRLKKSIPVYSILAIDRGAYFNLLRNNPDKARELVNTVTSKGGIIQLFSDLSKEAGERSRDIISKIKSLP